jgi:hypothetical protein
MITPLLRRDIGNLALTPPSAFARTTTTFKEKTMTTDLKQQLGELDQAWLDDMNKALQDGAGVQLPFPAISIWAHNGERKMAALAKTSPVSYFGGWHLDALKLQEMNESGDLHVPIEKLPYLLTEQQGSDEAYNVFETRVIHFAPLAYRMSWLSKDGRSRTPQYNETHGRSHLQYLGLLFSPVESEMRYVCPAVISVKGKGQTEAVKAALGAWKKVIDAVRKDINAVGLPLSAFCLSLGTTGDKPEFQAIGAGSQTSDITPIKAVMKVEKTDAEYISKRFIGAGNFTKAAQMLKEASDWLEAWKQAAATSPVAQTESADEIPW